MVEIIINEGIIYSTRYLIKLEEKIYISFYEYKTDEEYQCSNFIFYFDGREITSDQINEYFETIQSAVIDYQKPEDRNLNYINIQQGQLDIEPIFKKYQILPNKDSELNFYDFYPSKTRKGMRSVIKKIKNNTNGLYLMCGENGTGKTSFINYLSDKIKKPVIIVPFNIIHTFLTGIDLIEIVKQNPNTLFVIDDVDTFSDNYGSIFNGILQITNGILKKSVLSSFLLIFNNKNVNEIPKELIRKSEEVIHFNKLSVNEIKKILNDVDIDKIPTSETKIGDLVHNSKSPNLGSYL